jgi:hypothetical protein
LSWKIGAMSLVKVGVAAVSAAAATWGVIRAAVANAAPRIPRLLHLLISDSFASSPARHTQAGRYYTVT